MAPVSVVVPCYNARASIGRALASVAAQTERPAEVLVVDDASSDGSAELVEELARQHAAGWLRLVRLAANAGPASARNAGWNAAAQPRVAFLDADDTWHPRKLEIQARHMEANPDVAVCGHLHVVAEGGCRELRVPGNAAVGEFTFGDLLWRNRFITSSAMVRRELPLRFPHGQRHMEDHRLWLEIARAGLRITRIEAPLAAHHKADFGAAGLSGDLRAMERAELGNYRLLRHAGAIGAPLHAALVAWSIAKYARRVAIVALRRLST